MSTMVKPYKCTICGKYYYTKEDLKTHFFLHVKHSTFKCETCGKVLGSRKTLKQHLIMHNDPRPYPCRKCKRKFATPVLRSKHNCKYASQDQTQKSRIFCCKVCKKQFPGVGALRDHVNCHVSDRYKCVICNRCFSTKGHLKLHLLSHSKDSPHKCEKCEKTFGSKTALKFHMRVHPEEQLWKCDACGESFLPRTVPDEIPVDITPVTVPVTLEIEDIKPLLDHPLINDHNYFVFCSNRITLELNVKENGYDNSLEDHNYSYPNERQYRCDDCENVFHTNPTLEDHSYTDYRNAKQYKCTVCLKIYKNYFKYRSHVEIHSQMEDGVHNHLRNRAEIVSYLKLDFVHDFITMYG